MKAGFIIMISSPNAKANIGSVRVSENFAKWVNKNQRRKCNWLPSSINLRKRELINNIPTRSCKSFVCILQGNFQTSAIIGRCIKTLRDGTRLRWFPNTSNRMESESCATLYIARIRRPVIIGCFHYWKVFCEVNVSRPCSKSSQLRRSSSLR